MAITPEQARAELARREIARRASLNQEAHDTALNRAAAFVQPVTDILGAIGQAGDTLNNLAPYNPISILNKINSGIMNGASNLGEMAATGLAGKGLNPYAAATAGLGISMAPAIAQGIAAPSIPQAGIGSALATGEKAVASAAIPRVLKTTAGIPEDITRQLIQDSGLLKRLGGTPEAVASKMVEVQGLVQKAKSNIGATFGRIYNRYAKMDGPMQEIINTPIGQRLSPVQGDVPVAQKLVQSEVPRDRMLGGGTDTKLVPGDIITEKRTVGYKAGQLDTFPRQTHSYDDLLVNKNLAKQAIVDGNPKSLEYLFKEYVTNSKSKTTASQITDADKLQILTRLKREVSAQAKANLDTATLRPIDTAKDAAFKKMSSDLDSIRGNLPNGEKLALVDKAWEDINDIYGTIQKDLADPGKARDTFMRIAKGDSTWLTSGKFDNKLKAIQRVEKLTGQDILGPAMKELTALTFKQPYGKGIGYNTAPIAAGTLGLQQLFTGNIMSGAASLGSAGAMLAAGSPRLMGQAITGSARAAKVANRVIGAGVSQAPRISLGFGQKRKKQ